MRLNMTLEEINQRNGIMDEILEHMFDAAVLVDRDCRILFTSKGMCELKGTTVDETMGSIIDDEGTFQLFQEVMEKGIANYNLPILLFGYQTNATQIPIFEGDQVVGLLATLKIIRPGMLKEMMLSGTLSSEAYDAVSRTEAGYSFDDYAGQGAAVKELISLCRRAAMTAYPVLLIGETGTGKELISHAIHGASRTSMDSPFIRINCTAIPNELLESELFGYEKGAFTGAASTKQGKFELAAGGSILLDEIGDMDLRLQGKLLRVLEEREFERVGGNKLIPFNARIIASTNRNLKALCLSGQFRQDLYYRLNTLEITLPPLRDRQEDVPLLIERFNEKFQFGLSFDLDALTILTQYYWPGNVRQLKNVLTRLQVSLEDGRVTKGRLVKIFPEMLQSGFVPPVVSKGSKDVHDERMEVLSALDRNRHNISATAKDLGITRATLYNRIRKHGISVSRML